MRTFMTFGQRYRHDPHPTLPPYIAHPDGYIELITKPGALTEEILNVLFPGYLESKKTLPYAFLYVGETPEEALGDSIRYYPRGLVAVVTSSGISETPSAWKPLD